jgi:HPr kinase/phosphorylase
MSLKVVDFIKDKKLEVLLEGEKDKVIAVSDINRPGLQFAGFYNYFASERIQVVGNAEWNFLDAMHHTLRKKRLMKYFKFRIPCIVISRGLEPHPEFLESAKENNIWVLRTKEISTRFISSTMNYLYEKLALEIRMHGVLVDVYGIGVLIIGESGIGKSETALELIKRGHRLVADDAVDIKEIDKTLKGSSPFITSGMMEVRGMGIIDVPKLYGLSSVLSTKEINLIISLDPWKEDHPYDRLGIDDEFMEILDVPVKKVTIPIRPGRNIAVIIEAAAANYRYMLNSNITPVEIINQRMEELNNARGV